MEEDELFSVDQYKVDRDTIVQSLTYSGHAIFTAWRRNEAKSIEESNYSINSVIDGAWYFDLAEISEKEAYDCILGAYPELRNREGVTFSCGVITLRSTERKDLDQYIAPADLDKLSGPAVSAEDLPLIAEIQEEKSFSSWLRTLL